MATRGALLRWGLVFFVASGCGGRSALEQLLSSDNPGGHIASGGSSGGRAANESVGGSGGVVASGGSVHNGGSPGNGGSDGGSFATGGALGTGGLLVAGTGGVLGTGGLLDAGTGGALGTGGLQDAGSGGVGPGGEWCGGDRCTENEVCCLPTLRCFDPKTDPLVCMVQRPAHDQSLCVSSADCVGNEQGEFCVIDFYMCAGVGHCHISCPLCAAGPEACVICGCDGRTYSNRQEACLAGVPAFEGRCGEVVVINDDVSPPRTLVRCGLDSQCPDGMLCCTATGACYDRNTPALCRFAPEGTSYPCLDDTQCAEGYFCNAADCVGPGGCIFLDESRCTGEYLPVCGCDGKTYTNAGCAEAVGVRMRSWGTCP